MRTALGPRSRLRSLVAGRDGGGWPSQLVLAGTGALLIILFNPLTLGEWWLRSRHVFPGAALRVWCWDLAVLALTLVALAANRTRPRRHRDRRRPPVAARVLAAVTSVLVCALLLEGILRFRPGDALPESLR